MSDPPSSPSEPSAGKSPGELSLLLQKLAAADEGDEAVFLAGLQPGQLVGRFEVLREIGRGGFGAVYEALDRELGRSVAVKVLRPRRSGRAQAGEALQAEARAIAGLHHPGIVALFDLGECAAGPYLVEELLRGETLAERLVRGPLPLAEALPVAIAVARALSHAHRRGVVHRDLKPANVFLCEDGGVKLLDFGLAHLRGMQASPGAGTPAYMAPEQVLGAEAGPRSDVFAAATLLFECLAGSRPFPAGEEGFPHFDAPAASLPAKVPRPLARVVARGLSLDPEARPAGGQAWLEALRQAERRADRPARLRRLGALLAAGALAGAAIGGVAAWRTRPRLGDLPDEVRRTVAVLPFASLSGDEAEGRLADGVQVEMIATLSQRPDLVVIGRSSVEAWRKPPRDLPAIAAALGVGSVLEGSVQRAGNRIRIVISLLDPRTGRSLWAEKFDRDLGDVLAVQAEVSGQVARTLGARIAHEVVRPASARRGDPEALALYLQAKGVWTRSVGVSNDATLAKELALRAVARDSKLGVAHGLLAQVMAEEAEGLEPVARAAELRIARKHLEEALALEPQSPATYLGLLRVLWSEDRLDEYGPAAEEAYALAPDDPEILVYAMALYFIQGRWSAYRAAANRLARIDPRGPVAATYHLSALMFLGALDQARLKCREFATWMPKPRPEVDLWCASLRAWTTGDLSELRQLVVQGEADVLWLFMDEAAALAPASALARLDDPDVRARFPPYVVAFCRALAHERLGHEEEARRFFVESRHGAEQAAKHDPEEEWYVAWGLAGTGRYDEALLLARALARAPRKSWNLGLRSLSMIALRAGRTEEAIDALDESLSRLPLWTTPAMLRVDPRFEALHGDPRFEAMLAKHAKLPEVPDP